MDTNVLRNSEYYHGASTFDDFIAGVENMEKNTTWNEVPVKEIHVAALEGDPITADILAPAYGMDTELFRDGCEETGLIMPIDGKNLPFREMALASLFARAKISGTALNQVPKEELAHFLNVCFHTSRNAELAQAVVVGDKISAVHSNSYVRLDTTELFNIANEVLHAKFGTTSFEFGTISHESMTASYTMEDSALIEMYKDVTESRCQVEPVVLIQSSNVGMSGANIYPCFKHGTVIFGIGTPMCVEHKGSASVNKFTENINGVYAMMESGVKKLGALANISIQYPETCFLNVAKRVGVPKKYAIAALGDYKQIMDTSYSNAHDLYFCLTQAMLYAKADDMNEHQLNNLREIIARALTLKFSDYDMPTTEWKIVDFSNVA